MLHSSLMRETWVENACKARLNWPFSAHDHRAPSRWPWCTGWAKKNDAGHMNRHLDLPHMIGAAAGYVELAAVVLGKGLWKYKFQPSFRPPYQVSVSSIWVSGHVEHQFMLSWSRMSEAHNVWAEIFIYAWKIVIPAWIGPWGSCVLNTDLWTGVKLQNHFKKSYSYCCVPCSL